MKDTLSVHALLLVSAYRTVTALQNHMKHMNQEVVVTSATSILNWQLLYF